MTPEQHWQLRYTMTCIAFSKGAIDRVEFIERLWRLGFSRQDMSREIDLHKPAPPYNPGFHSGLAPETRY